MKRWMFLLVLLVLAFIPEGEPDCRIFLPVVQAGQQEGTLCVHPYYNDLPEHVGEVACFDSAYVERVIHFVGSERGVLLVSIVYVHEGWYGAVWAHCEAEICDVEAGQEIILQGEILGEHTMAGRYPHEGITIPAVRAISVD